MKSLYVFTCTSYLYLYIEVLCSVRQVRMRYVFTYLTERDWGESVYPVVYPEEAADTTDHRLPLRSISDL